MEIILVATLQPLRKSGCTRNLSLNHTSICLLSVSLTRMRPPWTQRFWFVHCCIPDTENSVFQWVRRSVNLFKMWIPGFTWGKGNLIQVKIKESSATGKLHHPGESGRWIPVGVWVKARRGDGTGQWQHAAEPRWQSEPGWAGGAGGRPEVSEGPTPMIVPRSEHWRKRNVHRFPSEFTSFPGYEQKDGGYQRTQKYNGI